MTRTLYRTRILYSISYYTLTIHISYACTIYPYVLYTDKVWPEEKFRDHMFATLAVNKLEQYLKDTNSDNMKYNFMLGVGFKNPHLQVSNFDTNIYHMYICVNCITVLYISYTVYECL